MEPNPVKIEGLVRQLLIELGEDVNREGLLQVDTLLYEFFLPEHRNARYA